MILVAPEQNDTVPSKVMPRFPLLVLLTLVSLETSAACPYGQIDLKILVLDPEQYYEVQNLDKRLDQIPVDCPVVLVGPENERRLAACTYVKAKGYFVEATDQEIEWGWTFYAPQGEITQRDCSAAAS